MEKMKTKRTAETECEKKPDRKPGKIPFYCRILMVIGLVTVIYLLITYVLIPILAMLTPS